MKGPAATNVSNGSVAGTSAWRAQVDRKFAEGRGVRLLFDKGYTRSHSVMYNVLAPNVAKTLYFDLDDGRHYIFAGLCDDDCSDMDLTLYDAEGELVDSDTKADAFPMVNVTPDYRMRYRVEVRIAKCATRTSGSGVMALAK